MNAFIALASLGLFLASGPALRADEPKPADTPAKAPEPEKKPEPTPTPASTPGKDQPAQGSDKAASAKPAEPAKEQFVHVVLKTTMGDITLELDQAKAPLSVENFLKYVDEKHYDGTVFHRVINGFMIQGGGFTAGGEQRKTRAPIKNEGGNGLKNAKYTVAMARTADPDSATSQFYINVADNEGLDRGKAADGVGYAVFGRVVAGQDVVDKIKATPVSIKRTPRMAMQDWPQTDVMINEAKRLSAEEVAKLKK